MEQGKGTKKKKISLYSQEVHKLCSREKKKIPVATGGKGTKIKQINQRVEKLQGVWITSGIRRTILFL